MSHPRSIAGVLSSIVLLVAAPGASACSCVGFEQRSELRKVFRSSAAAVHGELIERRRPGGGERLYTYRIARSFKRQRYFPEGETIKVRVPAEEGMCGYGAPIGSKRAFFVHRDRGKLHSNLCLQVSREQMRTAASGRSRRAGAGTSLDCGGG